MIRRWFSNFIKKNINKIKDLGTKLIMVAIVVFIATIIISFSNNSNNKETENLETYRPKETVIKGNNVSEEQYSVDYNIVKKFLEHCNNKTVEEAYNLLTDECKEELYPTIDLFKENYYNIVFDKERDYNIQSWITTKEYTVYKIRYTNNMLSTGTYNKDDVYQDYITLNKKSETEKLSIGNLIGREECDDIISTDELEIKVIRKKIYISDEEYEIAVTNKTDKTILLDNLNTNRTIKLISESGAEYSAYTNKIFLADLKIDSGITKNITVRFQKGFSSNYKSSKIQFLNIIRDYNTYIQNPKDYKDIINVTVKLEGR